MISSGIDNKCLTGISRKTINHYYWSVLLYGNSVSREALPPHLYAGKRQSYPRPCVWVSFLLLKTLIHWLVLTITELPICTYSDNEFDTRPLKDELWWDIMKSVTLFQATLTEEAEWLWRNSGETALREIMDSRIGKKNLPQESRL